MEKIYEVCKLCVDRYCCRGLCREMNDYLVKERENKRKKFLQLDSQSSKIKESNENTINEK